MSVIAKALFEAHYALGTDHTEYTVPANKHTIIDKFTATNTDVSSQTISVNLVSSGTTVSSSNLVISAATIASGATLDVSELKNQILNAGDFISVIASIASKVVIRASGRETA